MRNMETLSQISYWNIKTQTPMMAISYEKHENSLADLLLEKSKYETRKYRKLYQETLLLL
jgi:hypothetical protein